MKVLALDYGAGGTGVAVSDPTGTIARPLEVVEHASSDAGLARLAELVREHEAERVVVGLPLTLRGEHGAQAAETDRFVEALESAVDVPDRTVRRALHQHARGSRRRRGRPRRGPPPGRLPQWSRGRR